MLVFPLRYVSEGYLKRLVLESTGSTMAKKASKPAASTSVPSKSVAKAVAKAVSTPVETENEGVMLTRGPKQFTAAQYLSEYLVECKNGGTWASLIERTGFRLGNVRQCITQLRSEHRAMALAAGKAAPGIARLKDHPSKDKAIQIVAEMAGRTAEQYADDLAEAEYPFLQESGTRNTEHSKMRKALESKFSL